MNISNKMYHIPKFFKNRLIKNLRKDTLKQINLSLSSLCNANCIYCPKDRGNRVKQKFMSFEYAQKIINEVSSDQFSKIHSIERMSVSENGEAFLNNNIISILRLIKASLPHIKVDIFTNFGAFTKDKAEIILAEELIDTFCCNIDGFANFNYFNVKRLDLNKTRRNLMDFLEVRKELNSKVPLTILVLTLHNYIHSIHNHFGFYPSKIKDKSLINVPDDFLLIKKYFETAIDSKRDRIVKSEVSGWAEREKIETSKINYIDHTCRLLNRIKKEAFIAPDGNWYACCLDSNYDLKLGNVIKQSINEIYFSKKRRKFIRQLEKKKFEKIGGPCRTVNACEFLPG